MKWLLENYMAPQDGPCVRWPFAPNGCGYGSIRVNGRQMGAHVYALTLRDGPAPPGMEAAHGPCHDSMCIIHVSWKTPVENQADRDRDGSMLRGDACPWAKLTEADVREMRRLRSEGYLIREIADRFAPTPLKTVENVVAGRTWSWLRETA